MTKTLRTALAWKQVRTGAALVLALAVAALVVIPALGLILALLGLVILAIAQVVRRKAESR